MTGPQTTSPLITPADLAAALEGPEDARPVLVDVRWELGRPAEHHRAAYEEGHLPGAAFLDLEAVLSDPHSDDGHGGRHPMPSQERVEEGLRAAGVRADRPVVFYDAARSLGAARAWWVARYYGVRRSSVLDGGLAAWRTAGHPVQDGPVEVEPGDIALTPGGRELLEADDVVRWLDSGGQVLDSRPADRYRGENETMDPVAGHIPGALSLPALTALEKDGSFVSRERLAELLEQAGADDGSPVAVYCGSGVQASHLALALEGRGLASGSPAVYIGSWSDWVSDPSRPVATGPDAG